MTGPSEPPTGRRFVVVHTDERGEQRTLGVGIYTDLADAEWRVGERRRMAEAYGWRDRYDVAELVELDRTNGACSVRQLKKSDRSVRHMPRSGPRRTAVSIRFAEGGLAEVDRRAREEVPLKGNCEPNRSEMARRLLAYAITRMPKGLKP